MPIPASRDGSPDVHGKESRVTTPESSSRKPAPVPGALCWREIAQIGAEGAMPEGVALEHLIDLQRGRATPASGR